MNPTRISRLLNIGAAISLVLFLLFAALALSTLRQVSIFHILALAFLVIEILLLNIKLKK